MNLDAIRERAECYAADGAMKEFNVENKIGKYKY